MCDVKDSRRMSITERGSEPGLVRLHHWEGLFRYEGKTKENQHLLRTSPYMLTLAPVKLNILVTSTTWLIFSTDLNNTCLFIMWYKSTSFPISKPTVISSNSHFIVHFNMIVTTYVASIPTLFLEFLLKVQICSQLLCLLEPFCRIQWPEYLSYSWCSTSVHPGTLSSDRLPLKNRRFEQKMGGAHAVKLCI